MTDRETPGFKVVDKRRAASEDTASDADKVADQSTSDTPGTEPAETQGEPRSKAPSAETPDQEAPGREETQQSTLPEGEPGIPDAMALLSFAAMQMDVRTLAGALTAIFDGHAWRAMGFVGDPTTGELKKDLPAAQIAIDCMSFLLSKIESNIADNERRELQRRLTDLRMNYVAKLREG